MRAPRLKRRVVLIVGGTEGMGVQIVRAFLREGAIVVVPSSSAEQLERLREELHDFPSEDLVSIFGDMERLDEAERVRDVLLVRVGRLDAVVALLSLWCHCPSLVEASFEMWGRALDHLTTQFVIAHTFLPLLVAQGHGSYTLVKRTATERAVTQPDLSAIVGAAHAMLFCVLSEELADTHVRINEIIVCPDTSVCKGADDPSEGLAGDSVGTFTAWLVSEEAAPVRGASIRFVASQ